MVGVAEQSEVEELRVHIRNAQDSDLAYIMDSFRRSWMLALEHRRSRPRHFNRDFRELVVDGVLREPDTRIIVGCCPERPEVVLCWACYTPSRVPVLHFAYVRDERNGAPLRRRSLFSIMLSAMGVRDGMDVAYTFRPKELSSPRDRRSSAKLEPALLEAARRHGIVATYVPISEWLGQGGNGR